MKSAMLSYDINGKPVVTIDLDHSDFEKEQAEALAWAQLVFGEDELERLREISND